MIGPVTIRPPDAFDARGFVGIQVFFTPARSARTGLRVQGVPPSAGSLAVVVDGLLAYVLWERPIKNPRSIDRSAGRDSKC